MGWKACQLLGIVNWITKEVRAIVVWGYYRIVAQVGMHWVAIVVAARDVVGESRYFGAKLEFGELKSHRNCSGLAKMLKWRVNRQNFG